MRKLRLLPGCIFLLLVISALISCGLNQHKFKSLRVTPAAADAKDYPNGQVQYTVTATYIDGRQVTSISALWTPGGPWTLTPWPAISLSASGLASCGTVAPGIYPIVATAPIDPNFPISKMTMTTPQVSDIASLTCP